MRRHATLVSLRDQPRAKPQHQHVRGDPLLVNYLDRRPALTAEQAAHPSHAPTAHRAAAGVRRNRFQRVAPTGDRTINSGLRHLGARAHDALAPRLPSRDRPTASRDCPSMMLHTAIEGTTFGSASRQRMASESMGMSGSPPRCRFTFHTRQYGRRHRAFFRHLLPACSRTRRIRFSHSKGRTRPAPGSASCRPRRQSRNARTPRSPAACPSAAKQPHASGSRQQPARCHVVPYLRIRP